MALSKSAIAMLDYLIARSGFCGRLRNEISENDIRQATKISHGSFIAARKELVKRKSVEYEPQGGNKPPIYTLISGTSIDAGIRKQKEEVECTFDLHQDKKEQSPPAQPLMEEVQRMPRVTGEFSDFDEWTDSLMNELGECLDIEQSLADEEEYSVYSHQHCQRDMYRVTDVDGVLNVS